MKRKMLCSLLIISLFNIPVFAVQQQNTNNYTANNQIINNTTNNITNNVVNNQTYNYITNNTINNITNNTINNMTHNYDNGFNNQNNVLDVSIGNLNLFDNAQTAINRFIRNYQNEQNNVIYFSDADSQLVYGNWLLSVEKDENNLIKRISYSQYGNPTMITGITLGKTISIGNNKADLINVYGMWDEEVTNYNINVLMYNNLRYKNIPITLKVFIDTDTQLIYGYEITL